MPSSRDAAQKALYISAFLFWGFITGCVNSAPATATGPCQQTRFDETARVTKIYDGDTFKLEDGRVVRVIGINTPELSHDVKPAQAYAVEAKQALAALLPAGSKVGLVYDQDRQDHYQRTLAHVYALTGQNLAVELLVRGYGFAIVVPPNTGQTECYFNSERRARQQAHGLWANPAYTPKSSDSLTRHDTGFQYVVGTVTGIGQGKKNVWLDMGNHFSLRVQRKHLQYFTRMPLEALTGRQIRVRGWAAFYNDKLRMNIGHPAMMELVD